MSSHASRSRLPWPSRLGVVAALVSWSVARAANSDVAADGIFHWSISTVTEIDATPARVWRVLTDLPAYREWNPFIVDAAGTVAVGETLSLRMALPGRAPMTIAPRLLVVAPDRELRWKGRLLLPGLFDGEHAFELAPLAGGRTQLHHWERFGGVLLPLVRGMIYERTAQAFHSLNTALATRASSAMHAEAASHP